MLLLLIPIAWLTIATLVIVACRAAAAGDAAVMGARSAPVHERVVLHRPTRWQRVPVLAGSFRLSPSGTRPARGRARGARCATGS